MKARNYSKPVATFGKTVEIFYDQNPQNPLKDWDYFKDFREIDFISYVREFHPLNTINISREELKVRARDTENYKIFPLIFDRNTLRINLMAQEGKEGNEIEEAEGYIIYNKKGGIHRKEAEIDRYVPSILAHISAYSSGNVYGFVCLDNGEDIDDMWGFYQTGTWDELIKLMGEHMSEEYEKILLSQYTTKDKRGEE